MSDIFVELAREALTAWVSRHVRIQPPSPLPDQMMAKAGVFVSLHIGDDLRGCIGTFRPSTASIAHEIIEMAIVKNLLASIAAYPFDFFVGFIFDMNKIHQPD